tara:strand:- start:13855 stop:14214 length:360 start_codon:yes stop_codon:yes gene_type:complete
MYDRLTNYHKLNNLVWIWNSVAPEWYPGNDVVDIVSADTYAQGDHGPISATYNNLLSLTNDTKIIAATEGKAFPCQHDVMALTSLSRIYYGTRATQSLPSGLGLLLRLVGRLHQRWELE